MYGDAEKIDGNARHWIQILQRIIEWSRLEQRFVDMGLGAAEQQSVAIGLRSRHSRGTQRRPAAADVFNRDSSKQGVHFFRPGPADGVKSAPRWEWNDKADRS